MTKEYILEYFKDINFVYNDSCRYDDLEMMLNKLLEEIKAEIHHFMFEVNPSSSESDYACNYILDLIDKKMGKEGGAE